MNNSIKNQPADARLSSPVCPEEPGSFDRQQAMQGLLVSTGWSNDVRWRPGDRLHHLFEARCDQLAADGQASHWAVDSPQEQWTYTELDARANQLAHWLLSQGLGAGSIIALLLDKSAHSYIAMLAVQKIHAAYVPLDPAFPADRVAFIVADAGVDALLSLSVYADMCHEAGVRVIELDTIAASLDDSPSNRPLMVGAADHQLAYIIYTSGSTGRPKGVPISQANICNFVAVAAEVYGYRSSDRVYQGLTIAFDFAVEEIWVPLVVGATLLPNQTGSSLLGEDLHRFLTEQRATALCCVPTLLQTIDDELPALRLLIVSGEACPQDLIQRWWSPQCSILNAYGPTETTVTATLAFSQADEPVTIGKPLPSYTVMILAPDEQRVLPFGEEGEICVAGIGVADGYLNRPDQTAAAFISDFVGVANNPSGLIYRTGDLGSINAEGNVEYRGRIDLQVKIRGYRIELTEIESALLQIPGIAQAVVDTFEPMPGAKELVAYYTLQNDLPDPGQDALVHRLRELMPAYMVPAYYEPLDTMPMLASDKADRKSLPAPRGLRMRAGNRLHVPAESDSEKVISAALASLLQMDDMSVEDHFFDDLGANSLLMARLGASLRKALPGCQVAMQDFYTRPTVRQLADYLDSKSEEEHQQVRVDPWYQPSRLSYWLCGSAQMFTYLIMMAATVWIAQHAVPWVLSEPSAVSVYVRVAILTTASLLGWLALSLSAKWLLIGRWKPMRIPLWSIRFFRFWLVKLLIQTNPLALLKGSPLYNLYLRMLGARIGRNVVLELKQFPLCTDLLDVGDHSVIRQDARLVTHKARCNYMYTGGVSLGRNVSVGEGSLLDMDTAMGDGAQLAHASALLQGQTIPAGQVFHGNPAEQTEGDFRFDEARPVSTARIVVYSLLQLLFPMWVVTPLLALGLYEFATWLELPSYKALSVGWFFMLFDEVLLAFVGGFLALLFGSAVIARLANRLIEPGKTYVMFGFHYTVYRFIRSASNVKLFVAMFGDSSYITGYLKMIGYDLGRLIQTGSNFGMTHQQDNPALCSIGSGTMISDGLHLMNVQESSTAFRLLPLRMGEENFVGNMVYYPAEAKVGNNCLLATKVMLPTDGALRENCGLLGSPCFEIPRSIERDAAFEPATRSTLRITELPKKNRHNLWTMFFFMTSNFLYVFVAVLITSLAAVMDGVHGHWVWLLAFIGQLAFTVGFFVLLERWSLGFGRMRPAKVSIYDPLYWRVERYWKLNESPLRYLWKGTPMRNQLNRWLGMRLGKMVYDEGFSASEKTLVEIGDHCNFNDHSLLQSHSLEDGIFKSDYIKIGNRCSFEAQAFIQYGVKAGDNVLVTADACVIKTEVLSCNTCWSGNPAYEIALVERDDNHVEALASRHMVEPEFPARATGLAARTSRGPSG